MRLGLSLLFLCVSLPLIAFLAACESTQSKSKRLAKQAKGLVREQGLVVRKQNRSVKVPFTTAVQDANGTAVVVTLRNVATRALANLPVSIDVVGSGGRSVFRNNLPGLDPSLTHVSLLKPKRSLVWVNDQVNATGKPQRVKVKVGSASASVPKAVPKITISGVRLRIDPVDGPEAVGAVANRSSVEQRKLVIFGVSRRGGRVVAAGRAIVNRLKAHKRARFQMFFIGDPRGGRISVSAPPSVLRKGARS